MVAGELRLRVARLNDNGTLDLGYNVPINMESAAPNVRDIHITP